MHVQTLVSQRVGANNSVNYCVLLCCSSLLFCPCLPSSRPYDIFGRFGLDQLPLEMAVFDAVAATGPPLVPAKATTTSSASGSGAGGAGGGFAVGAFGNSGGAGLGAASGDPGMPPLFFAGPTGKYNAAQAPPVPTSFTNTADLKASLLSTSINFPPLGPGLHGPSVVGTSGATKDQGDDATAIHPKAGKLECVGLDWMW